MTKIFEFFLTKCWTAMSLFAVFFIYHLNLLPKMLGIFSVVHFAYEKVQWDNDFRIHCSIKSYVIDVIQIERLISGTLVIFEFPSNKWLSSRLLIYSFSGIHSYNEETGNVLRKIKHNLMSYDKQKPSILFKHNASRMREYDVRRVSCVFYRISGHSYDIYCSSNVRKSAHQC